jgi:hypothetical protein
MGIRAERDEHDSRSGHLTPSQGHDLDVNLKAIDVLVGIVQLLASNPAVLAFLVALGQLLAVGITLVIAGLTYMTVRANRDMVDEMRLSREAVQEPYVVAYAEPLSGAFYVTTENTGRSPAYDVTVTRVGADAPTRFVREATIFDLRFLPPGAKARRLYDFPTLGTEKKDFPPVELICRWADRARKTHEAPSFIDVAAIIEAPRDPIVEELKQIGRKIENIRRL